MARRRDPQPVLLVHGIMSRGAWQDKVANDLSRFFIPRKVRYRQFDGPLAPIIVACEPWILFPAIGIAIVLAVWFVPTRMAVMIGLILGAFSVSPWAVRLRREAAQRIYLQRFGECIGRAPHVIAHSFGTYLTARLLDTVRGIRFGRIVLCGSVLRRDYDWMVHIDRQRVNAIRNDFTRQDWVGWFACLAGWLRDHDHVGNCGTHGMRDGMKGVHRLDDPLHVCGSCTDRATGRIHDVDCTGRGHSGTFLIQSHLRDWWLPFLWGLDSGEHRQWLEFCTNWFDATEKHDWAEMERIERELESRIWRWCGHRPLNEHLARALRDCGRQSDPEAVKECFQTVAVITHDARATPLNSLRAVFLEPDYAVNVAAAARA